MMRHLRTLLIVLVIFGVGIGVASAAPVTVTSSLPYVWVRAAPSSYAGVIYTVYPTGYATLETTGATQWDGYQTWVEVYLIANSGVRGWVEQGSVVSASSQAAAPAQYWPANVAPAQAAQYWGANVQAQAAPAQNWGANAQAPAQNTGWQGQAPSQPANAPAAQPKGLPVTFGNAGWQGGPR